MIIDTNEIYSVDAEGRVFSGYDTPKREFYVKPSEEWEEQSTASVADKLALADAMIARWVAYKDMVGK